MTTINEFKLSKKIIQEHNPSFNTALLIAMQKADIYSLEILKAHFPECHSKLQEYKTRGD